MQNLFYCDTICKLNWGGYVENLIDLIKLRDLMIPRVLMKNYRKMKISEFEFVILIYYINELSLVYNPKKVGQDVNAKTEEVMEAVASLQNKNIITIKIEEENKMKAEYICLDNLYKQMGIAYVEVKKEEKNETIFDRFEQEFGRTLSPVEFEIINAWRDQRIGDELILEALKEAIYNGARSLRYIDAVLNDWTKKGYQKVNDIKKQKKSIKVDKKLFEYDWLNEE